MRKTYHDAVDLREFQASVGLVALQEGAGADLQGQWGDEAADYLSAVQRDG